MQYKNNIPISFMFNKKILLFGGSGSLGNKSIQYSEFNKSFYTFAHLKRRFND